MKMRICILIAIMYIRYRVMVQQSKLQRRKNLLENVLYSQRTIIFSTFYKQGFSNDMFTVSPEAVKTSQSATNTSTKNPAVANQNTPAIPSTPTERAPTSIITRAPVAAPPIENVPTTISGSESAPTSM